VLADGGYGTLHCWFALSAQSRRRLLGQLGATGVAATPGPALSNLAQCFTF
jgi:hypothetical protein